MQKCSHLKEIVLIILIIFSLTGCKNAATFSGSKTGNNNQFLVDFDILNTTVESTMDLIDGDVISTSVMIVKGSVDINVQNENGEVVYRGNDVESNEFSIDIHKSGTYTFSLTGRKAEGRVYFVKLE